MCALGTSVLTVHVPVAQCLPEEDVVVGPDGVVALYLRLWIDVESLVVRGGYGAKTVADIDEVAVGKAVLHVLARDVVGRRSTRHVAR